ncbi:hypothetical protein F7725_004354 [Dissostichus mawsoni]|uniref:Uncharacterized protein n=1 Tax=Dissostichus mawsoni TaxID=36200 RepID=A0A7J5XIT5_DISMA|nr:hypothetical protein F7725_004354 [Dissostichus mawsoni]
MDGERDLVADYRLSRRSLEALMQLLPDEESHGWGHTITILITVYWLAHGLSYSVVCRAFQVPKSTVYRLKEEEIERKYRRRLSARRRRMFCRHLCGERRARAHHYCIINATVPVLQRYFADEDTRPDFRLGREAIQQLLVALKTERQHGWGPTLETLVFLFWIASGSAYRVVSRVFDVPLPSVHRIVHRMVDEVVAVLPQFVRLPRVEDLPGVGEGFAPLAHHQAFRKGSWGN